MLREIGEKATFVLSPFSSRFSKKAKRKKKKRRKKTSDEIPKKEIKNTTLKKREILGKRFFGYQKIVSCPKMKKDCFFSIFSQSLLTPSVSSLNFLEFWWICFIFETPNLWDNRNILKWFVVNLLALFLSSSILFLVLHPPGFLTSLLLYEVSPQKKTEKTRMLNWGGMGLLLLPWTLGLSMLSIMVSFVNFWTLEVPFFFPFPFFAFNGELILKIQRFERRWECQRCCSQELLSKRIFCWSFFSILWKRIFSINWGDSFQNSRVKLKEVFEMSATNDRNQITQFFRTLDSAFRGKLPNSFDNSFYSPTQPFTLLRDVVAPKTDCECCWWSQYRRSPFLFFHMKVTLPSFMF